MGPYDGVIQPNEVFKVSSIALNGHFTYGKGPAIRNIALDIINNNNHITLDDIHQNFQEYWYDKMLMRRYSARYKPSSYIIGCLYLFLMQERRRLNTIKSQKNNFVPLLPDDIFPSEPRETYKDDDGTWRQHNIISDFNMTECSGVEKAYLQDELNSLIEDFTLEEYGNTYLNLFRGKISQSEAAEVEGCSRRWINEKWSQYKHELISYLLDCGYDADDILKIYY